ncbi:MAG: hypothetical protein ACI9OJ_000905 [Myxococcota bacterium]|jgi:hypothetical protein
MTAAAPTTGSASLMGKTRENAIPGRRIDITLGAPRTRLVVNRRDRVLLRNNEPPPVAKQ